MGMTLASNKQLPEEQSRQIAATILEELARRRISRRRLAEEAKISISTLEKALGGSRTFTLATTVRLEEALGLPLRKHREAPRTDAMSNGAVAPDSLGAYSRRAVSWIEGNYITLRPSFGDQDAIYAYLTEIHWSAESSRLVFREGERLDRAFAQFGEVAVPNLSGHVHLVTNQNGQHRLITVSRPTITGEMYGILMTLLAGRGSLLMPITAPIAFVPLSAFATPTFGRIAPNEPNHALYRAHLLRTLDEPFALFKTTRLTAD
jgi:transcriptional regulator with XRE-family HTH domain